MATFVKKVGNNNYYHIDNIRAGGIVPFYIENNKVYILINTENRKNKIIDNCIGGKVDKLDRNIEDTMIREFNEETGFIVSKRIRQLNKISNKRIKMIKAKYISMLIDIKGESQFKLLPYNYDEIFKGVEFFNHRDSLKLKWIELFNYKLDNASFLLKVLMHKIRRLNKFRDYNKNTEPLFV